MVKTNRQQLYKVIVFALTAAFAHVSSADRSANTHQKSYKEQKTDYAAPDQYKETGDNKVTKESRKKKYLSQPKTKKEQPEPLQ
ncbi:MAG: hypothetical protein V3W04_15595 [Gammaproteobacteria bacterium]